MIEGRLIEPNKARQGQGEGQASRALYYTIYKGLVGAQPSSARASNKQKVEVRRKSTIETLGKQPG